MIPIAAVGLAETEQHTILKIIRWAFLYTAVYYLLLIAAVNFYSGTFGKGTEPYLGKADISLDAYGWKEAGEKFGRIYNKYAFGSDHPLVCNDWWGAHEEYYFARPLHIRMIGLGSLNTLHNYAWKNRYTMPLTKPDTAFCIVHSDEYYDVKKAYAGYYSEIDSLSTIHILRNNLPAHNFYVYRLSGWLK